MANPKERVLDDDYPVYAGYAYVADGKPFLSEIEGTVGRVKRRLGAKEITNCDLIARADERAPWR
jgi:hypothetical protein